MDLPIVPARTDLVTVTSEPRPTPRPSQTSFSEVLATGASGIAAGAEMAMNVLPGMPLVAAAIRGGGGFATPSTGLTVPLGNPSTGTLAEGPGALGALGNLSAGGTGSGSIESSLAQSQQSNLYYLQVQQQVNAQSQSFETLSNVMKSESDTIKNAISNLH